MADYSEDVARYAADKAGADYDAAVTAGHTPQTIIQDALGNGYVSHEDLARYAANKSGVDYNAATAAGHTPQTIIQQTTGYEPAQNSSNEHLFGQEFRSSPGEYLSSAEIGGLLGAKVGMFRAPGYFAYDKAKQMIQANNPNTPWGLEAYVNSAAGHTRPKNVPIPVSKFEQLYGQPITQQSEFQDFLKIAKNSPGVSPNALQQKYQNLLTSFQTPTASPEVMKHLSGQGLKYLAKGVTPVISGTNAGIDLQDALDRFEAGETGRGVIGMIGAGASAAAPFAGLVPTIGPALTTGLAATGVAAPLVNMGLDTVLGHPSVFEKKNMNVPYKVFPQGRPAGMKEGGSTAEMKAALKMKNGGLYENIHAKQERIAHGSGEHMRKPGSAGAPSEQDFIESAKTAKMKEGGLSLSVGRGEKLPVSQGAGLTEKGREKYNRETGSHLQAPQPEGGPRKDSFCARMQGVVDHAKGDAERAKASLKRWKC